MIPVQAVTEWQAAHPWENVADVEQDLLLSRLMVEVGRHPQLRRRLALSGGTCIHKLHSPQPGRYSEDLDFVVPKPEHKWQCANLLSGLVKGLNLPDVRGFKFKKGPFPGVRMDYIDVIGDKRHLKMEIAAGPLGDHAIRKEYSTDSSWFQGQTDLLCIPLNAILATKVAAMYGRKKPRDFMDLWFGVSRLGGDPQEIADYFRLVEVSPRWNTFTALESMTEKLNDDGYKRTMRDTYLAGWEADTLPEAATVFREVASCVGRKWHRETSNTKYKKFDGPQRQRLLDAQSRLMVSHAGRAAAEMKAATAEAVPTVAPVHVLNAPVSACGKWMPRARVRCALSKGHAGGCRSRR